MRPPLHKRVSIFAAFAASVLFGSICVSEAGKPSPVLQTPEGIITTIAGTGRSGFSGDGGLAVNAMINFPSQLAIDGAGNIFFSDSGNRRVRRIDAGTGIITTVAGNGSSSFSGDGGPATAAGISNAAGLAVDATGNLYIVDKNSNRVRRVEAGTGIIKTFAGNGSSAFNGDGGPASGAALRSPNDVAVDAAGNLFIVDQSNNRIRRVDAATGIIATVAGSGGSNFGDGGPATSAALRLPSSIALDAAGNLFIADQGNNLIRRVDAATKTIMTIAGNGESRISGDGGLAPSAGLSAGGVAVDSLGNIFIADFNNNRVRRIDAVTRIITTVAGSGDSVFNGDGGLATGAAVGSPLGVEADASGNIVIADRVNDRIRKVAFSANQSNSVKLSVSPSSQTAAPGASANFTVNLARTNFNGNVDLSVSGLPSGASRSFNPASVAGNSSTLTVNTSASTPVGSYVLTISGAANGATVSQTSATLVVSSSGGGAGGDFSLIVMPTSREIAAGQSTTFTATVSPINGFSETVSISTDAFPSDQNLQISASPSNIMPNGTATLNVRADAALKGGSYTITIFGQTAQLTKRAAVTLNVAEQGYTLSFNQPEITVSPKGKGTVAVNINRSSGFNANVTVTPDADKLKALKIKFTPPTASATGSSVTFNFKVKKTASPGRFELRFTGQDNQGGPPRVQTLFIVIQ